MYEEIEKNLRESQNLKESDDDFVSIEKLNEKVEQLNALIELMQKNNLEKAHCDYNMPHCDCISFPGIGYLALTDDVYDEETTLSEITDEV